MSGAKNPGLFAKRAACGTKARLRRFGARSHTRLIRLQSSDAISQLKPMSDEDKQLCVDRGASMQHADMCCLVLITTIVIESVDAAGERRRLGSRPHWRRGARAHGRTGAGAHGGHGARTGAEAHGRT